MSKLHSMDISIGDKIKLNHEGIAYLYDAGFKTIPDTLEVTDRIYEDDHYYFTTYETGDKIRLMIGEIASKVQ